MFSTFADVFSTNDDENKSLNGTTDPFGCSTATTTATTMDAMTVDPFGVSNDMKLSASSHGFDDSPFSFDNFQTKQDKTSRIQTVKDSNEIPTFDPLADVSKKTSSLNVGNIVHSKSINLIDPFLIPTVQSGNTHEPVVQSSPIDLLFDLNVDPSSFPLNDSADAHVTTIDKSLRHSDQVQSSYDLLGLNRSNQAQTTTSKVLKSDSLTEIEKLSQTKKGSPASLLAKSNIHAAASYHNLPTTAPPTSPSTLRVQATALSIMTGATSTNSTAPYDDQFLDWLTQSDDLMCGVDPKLSGPSKKIDINMIKSTEDLLGSIYRPIPTLSTVRMYRIRSFRLFLFSMIKCISFQMI